MKILWHAPPLAPTLSIYSSHAKSPTPGKQTPILMWGCCRTQFSVTRVCCVYIPNYFVFHCFLATVRIFVSCYCSLFVCFFFFLCFLLFFVFIVLISHSVSVSEMKLFVRLTLCVFSNYDIMSSSPISYSLLMST